MKTQLSKSWWFLLVKGLLFIFFGALVTFYPKETLYKMFFLLGLIILLGGIIILGFSLMHKKDNKDWKGLMAFGVVDIGLGLFVMIFTNLALHLLIFLMGIWAILIGVYQLIQFFSLPKEVRQKSLTYIIGLIAIIFGLIMVLLPKSTSLFMTVMVGILSMVLGAMLTGTALKFRKKAA